MGRTPQSYQPFLDWFQSQGGTVDLTSMGITDFPNSEGGRGAIALKDIPEGHVLFSIPRSMTLSTRTSSLPSLFGIENWMKFKLHKGWSGLILSMMWEAAQGSNSKWAQYMDILPGSFDTPMFWDENDLSELKGTSIVEKLGKDDAEKDFQTKLKPAIECRPDLFPMSEHSKHYSFEVFHHIGSCILSRSFDVEKWQLEEDEEDEVHQADKSSDSAMDIDGHYPEAAVVDAHSHGGGSEEGEDGNEDEAHDSSDTAMVPMADMLNARFGSENAKLFHEKYDLKMISTKFIKSGEQIWNTYGDLPNSELLRRYGHVDVLPLPNGDKGNPGDVAEVRADGIVNVLSEIRPEISIDSISERIDWWLEEGGDDTFEFDLDLDYPDALLSITRLLLLSDSDWTRAQQKSKPPKPKGDVEVLSILQKVIQRRLKEYPTSIDEDRKLLQTAGLPLNLHQAVIVRLGEKNILDSILTKLSSDIEQQSAKQNKRKAETQAEVKPKGHKKSRR